MCIRRGIVALERLQSPASRLAYAADRVSRPAALLLYTGAALLAMNTLRQGVQLYRCIRAPPCSSCSALLEPQQPTEPTISD
jgi:hypothetical protein